MAFNFPYRLSKIATKTASSSASLSFTSGISSNFTTYYIKVRRLVPATNNTQLLMTFSTNGGSSYLSTNYKYAFAWVNTNVSSGNISSDSDSSIKVSDSCSNVSTQPMNLDMVLYNLNDSTYCVKTVFQGVIYGNGSLGFVQEGGGMNTGTTAINAIKFAQSSGNLTSGTITLYGVVDGGLMY